MLTELVNRDLDYGPYCYDDYYDSDEAKRLRQTKNYDTAVEFVRNMLRRHRDGK